MGLAPYTSNRLPASNREYRGKLSEDLARRVIHTRDAAAITFTVTHY